MSHLFYESRSKSQNPFLVLNISELGSQCKMTDVFLPVLSLLVMQPFIEKKVSLQFSFDVLQVHSFLNILGSWSFFCWLYLYIYITLSLFVTFSKVYFGSSSCWSKTNSLSELSLRISTIMKYYKCLQILVQMFVHHSQKPLHVGSYLDATLDCNILLLAPFL